MKSLLREISDFYRIRFREFMSTHEVSNDIAIQLFIDTQLMKSEDFKTLRESPETQNLALVITALLNASTKYTNEDQTTKKKH
jgi:hypothetical protein